MYVAQLIELTTCLCTCTTIWHSYGVAQARHALYGNIKSISTLSAALWLHLSGYLL